MMKKTMDFETAAAELEEILSKLADEATPLAQSLTLYAKAAELIAFCDDTLKKAQMQIDEVDAKLAAHREDADEEGQM